MDGGTKAALTRSVQVEDGIDLSVRITGSGDPVLIPMACWCEEHEVLATAHQIVLYDARGRGHSSAVSLDRISFDNDIRDLDAVRASIGADRVALIGWSCFGGVVARYGMLYPERVTRLALVSPGPVRAGEFLQSVLAEQNARMAAAWPEMAVQFGSGMPAPETWQKLWDTFVDVRSGRKPPWPAMVSRPFDLENETPERSFPVAMRAAGSVGDWDWRMMHGVLQRRCSSSTAVATFSHMRHRRSGRTPSRTRVQSFSRASGIFFRSKTQTGSFRLFGNF